MARRGFIDHIGLGVADLPGASYHDEPMPVLGPTRRLPRDENEPFTYGSHGTGAPQLFSASALQAVSPPSEGSQSG
jgi:hypothetical protein